MSHHAAAVLTVHALRARDTIAARLRHQRGQGTVEYVGLMLLIAGVLAAVVVWAHGKNAGIGQKVTGTIRKAIDEASGGGK
jgi:hypothetical protein